MNLLGAAALSVFSVVFLLDTTRRQLRADGGRFNILGMYCILVLFFVAIPLAFDAILLNFFSEEETVGILCEANVSSIVSYETFSADVVFDAALYTCIFNILLVGTAACLLRFLRLKNGNAGPEKDFYYPSWLYYAAAWAGIFLWAGNYGLNFAQAGFGYRSNVESSSSVLNILAAVAMSAALPGLNLETKNVWSRYCIIMPPFAVIAYLTRARALFIGMLLVVFYYFTKRFYSRKAFCFLAIAASYAGVSLCTMMRMDHPGLLFYPLWRDLSFPDMYYCFAYAPELYNSGDGLYNLAVTGLKFLQRKDVLEITEQLAEMRFHANWGSLHPTIFGWCMIDAGWFSLWYALFWSLVMVLSEALRRLLNPQTRAMYLGIQFTFVACLVRGSCQYAYASAFLYPTICFFFGGMTIALIRRKVL